MCLGRYPAAPLRPPSLRQSASLGPSGMLARPLAASAGLGHEHVEAVPHVSRHCARCSVFTAGFSGVPFRVSLFMLLLFVCCLHVMFGLARCDVHCGWCERRGASRARRAFLTAAPRRLACGPKLAARQSSNAKARGCAATTAVAVARSARAGASTSRRLALTSSTSAGHGTARSKSPDGAAASATATRRAWCAPRALRRCYACPTPARSSLRHVLLQRPPPLLAPI